MNIIFTLLLICGLIFFTGGTLGILRFPDFYSRLHPAGKLDTFGLVTTIGTLALYIAFSQGSFLTALKILEVPGKQPSTKLPLKIIYHTV